MRAASAKQSRLDRPTALPWGVFTELWEMFGEVDVRLRR
jgi:hypothetical protein